MYIKQGLVFNKSNGSLTGFTDFGKVNNLLLAAEQKYKDPDSVQQRPLAKCLLAIMLSNSLIFPYAQFPASSKYKRFSIISHFVAMHIPFDASWIDSNPSDFVMEQVIIDVCFLYMKQAKIWCTKQSKFLPREASNTFFWSITSN